MSKLLDLWADMTGVVLDYALSTPPSSAWLMCYGQALLPGDSATARLRQKLIDDEFPYGDDGDGNPLVPDARGRTVAGRDNMGGAAANRLNGGNALGAGLGSDTHTLTTDQMPAHNHSGTATSSGAHTHTVSGTAASAGNHNHDISGVYSAGSTVSSGVNWSGYMPVQDKPVRSTSSDGAHTHSVSGTAASNGAHTHTLSVNNSGGGQPMPIVQPTLVLNKIIKL